jgi:transcriptional regulator with XRE-family HTH domain
MNPVERLRDYVRRKHPEASSELTPPLREGGMWSLDIDWAAKKLAVEWSDVTGFGVSSINIDNFGERPDETFSTLAEVQGRVTQLLTTAEQTSPPYGISLGRLRERRGVTQQELAHRLEVRQATISGMERRDDIRLSTLRRIVAALGGALEIFGGFPEARYRIDIHRSGDEDQTHFGSYVEEGPVVSVAQSVRFHYDSAFPRLREAGCLERATEIASGISSRRAVIEMPRCEP